MNVQQFVTTNFYVSTDDKEICDAAQKLINEAGAIISDVTALDNGALRLTYKDTNEVVFFTATQGFALLDKGVLTSPHFQYGGVSKNFKQLGYKKTVAAVKKAVKAGQIVLTATNLLIEEITNAFTARKDYLDNEVTVQKTALDDTLQTAISSPDLIDSYLKVVASEQPLFIDSLPIDAVKTSRKLAEDKVEEERKIAYEALKSIINQVEGIFNTFNDIDIDTVLDGNLLEVEIDGYYPEHKTTITNALKAQDFKVSKVVELPKHNKAYFTVVLK